MIPICLVTGFLGSGKTTFLQRIVDRSRRRPIAYLVNEYSPLDVDGSRLEVPSERLTSIAGGSIFCRCRVSDFMQALRRIEERHGGSALDGVVVEASGVASPKPILTMLEETGLDEVYALSSIVTVVDPGTFRKLLQTLPAVLDQVEAADVVIINKIDLYAEPVLSETRDELRRIHPDVALYEAKHCDVDVELFDRTLDRSLAGELAECADPAFSRAEARIDCPVNWPRLRRAIDDARGVLYRVKGFVPVPGGVVYADLSPSGWSTEAMSGQVGEPGLVLIARGDADATLQGLVRRIEAGDFVARGSRDLRR